MDATFLVDFAVGLVLALVLFGVGLSLSVSDFTNIIRHPKAFFTALGVQMLGLPLLAFAVNLLAPVPPEVKVGFIILAASPGGATSGFLAYLWRGNVALSLSLTSVNSFLTLFSIPLVVNIGLNVFMGRSSDLHLPFWYFVQHIFLITIIPASLGIAVRYFFPAAAERLSKPARYVMLALLGIVFAVKIFAGEKQGGAGLELNDFLVITPVALVQNALCLFFGYYMMQWTGQPHASRLTASMESGVQNTSLAFLIATILINTNNIASQTMVKPALIYSMFSFWTACLFAWVQNRRNGHDATLRI
ncbi:MAG: bile acid:sodium symporter family protein [Chitinophagales bacterium]|nr:bile acid:sodium symporter family protein [Chitinophagales bacterium]